MNSWILCWQEVVPAASRKRLCEKTDYVDLEAPAAKKHAELNLRCVPNSQSAGNNGCLFSSVGDPDADPQDPHVFGPLGSRSICQMYGSFAFLNKMLSGLKYAC